MNLCARSGCGYPVVAVCQICRTAKCENHLPPRDHLYGLLALQRLGSSSALPILHNDARSLGYYINPLARNFADDYERVQTARRAGQAFYDWYDQPGVDPQCIDCVSPRIPDLEHELEELVAWPNRQRRAAKNAQQAEQARQEKDQRDREVRVTRQVAAFLKSPASKNGRNPFRRRWLLGERTHTSVSASEYHGYPETTTTRKVWLNADGSTSELTPGWNEAYILQLFKRCGFTPPP